MQIWETNKFNYSSITNDLFLTKDLNCEIKNVVFDLREYNGIQLIEVLDVLKNRTFSYVLVNESELEIINSFLQETKNFFVSIFYDGSDINKVFKLLNTNQYILSIVISSKFSEKNITTIDIVKNRSRINKNIIYEGEVCDSILKSIDGIIV